MQEYKYFRIHSEENAYLTKLPRGLFSTIWKLVENKTMTEEEIEVYWRNRKWFEENLPVPPFYKEDNPQKAITWYINNEDGKDMFSRMTHYFDMARKYNVELFLTTTDVIPGEVIYEDRYQIAVKDSLHNGPGFRTQKRNMKQNRGWE